MSHAFLLSALDTALAITAIVSIVLYYHWTRFAPSHLGAVITMVVYTLGVAVLVVGLLGIVSTL